MAFFRRRAGSLAVCFISSLLIPIALSKSCKKIDNCKCEMDDGSGIINIWDLDNSDGTPRFKNILENLVGSPYEYDYNPCTPIKSPDACAGSNLCQIDKGTSKSYPCDASDPSFTIDASSNHVVMTYTTRTYDDYTRTPKITLVCDKNDDKVSFSKVSQTAGQGASATYSATLTAKSACPVPSSLSIGSILLIIFFPLVLLYLVIGILFNIYVRHKKSVPEVLPNHTFWADFPFLVKDGFVFSYGKMKYCCGALCAKARNKEYESL